MEVQIFIIYRRTEIISSSFEQNLKPEADPQNDIYISVYIYAVPGIFYVF